MPWKPLLTNVKAHCRVCKIPIDERATWCRKHGRSHQQRGTAPRVKSTPLVREWQQQPDLPAHVIEAILARAHAAKRPGWRTA